MNLRLTLNVLGWLLVFMGAVLLFPILFSFWFADGEVMNFLASAVLTAGAGYGLTRWFRSDRQLTVREGFGIVTFGWLAFAIFGALPYMFGGILTNPILEQSNHVGGVRRDPRGLIGDGHRRTSPVNPLTHTHEFVERAVLVLAEPDKDVREFVEKRKLTHIVGDGYYAFLNLSDQIARAGLADSEALTGRLAEEFGLAAVPGAHFSQAAAQWIRFSYALPPEITRRATERLWSALETLANQ